MLFHRVNSVSRNAAESLEKFLVRAGGRVLNER